MTWYLEACSPQDNFCNVIGLVCPKVTMFLPTQRARLTETPRYLERVQKTYGEVSEKNVGHEVDIQNLFKNVGIYSANHI